jgi:hypothetical protein
MIPPFDDTGRLPPGIHSATLTEVEQRFGRGSELRRVQFDSIRWMIDLAKRTGVSRIVLNGSFVTDIIEPNDVDCALLMGPGFPKDRAAESELLKGLPFLDLSLVDDADLDYFVNRLYAQDRTGEPKGMIEVIV